MQYYTYKECEKQKCLILISTLIFDKDKNQTLNIQNISYLHHTCQLIQRLKTEDSDSDIFVGFCNFSYAVSKETRALVIKYHAKCCCYVRTNTSYSKFTMQLN